MVAEREIETVVRIERVTAVSAEQGVASEEVVCDETEVVARDDQKMVPELQLIGPYNKARMHCSRTAASLQE